MKGRTSRFSTIDTTVDVLGRTAKIQEGDKTSQTPVPDRYFCSGGFAPVSVQMMLIRDWERKRVGGRLQTLPSGAVTIDKRGRDVIEVTGKHVELDRYSVGGVVWGRETLWFDPEQKLVAAITVDAEFNRFEAIREGFEPALSFFVARAAEDGMAVLAELADHFSPKQAGPLAIVGATLIAAPGAPPVEELGRTDRGRQNRRRRLRGAGHDPGRRDGCKRPGAGRTAGALGYARTFHAGRMGTGLPGRWGHHGSRLRPMSLNSLTAARDAIAAGRGWVRRLLPAGIIDGEGPTTIGVDTASTPEQALALVKRYADAGFPQIKIYSSLPPELVATIAQEAHRRGMTVTGHVPDRMDLERAVADGMDQINHIPAVAHALRTGDSPTAAKAAIKPSQPGTAPVARSVDPESDRARRIIHLLKEHGTVIDPTVALYELMLHPAGRNSEPGLAKVAVELAGPLKSMGVSPDAEKIADAYFRQYLEVIGALHKAGVPIVAGTDQAVPGHSLHRELELYVEAGMTPSQAIQSATIVPAARHEPDVLDRRTGTIEAGKQGDLIPVCGSR